MVIGMRHLEEIGMTARTAMSIADLILLKFVGGQPYFHLTFTLLSPYLLSPYFQLRDEGPFAFAGIWDEWGGDKLSIRSCAIITTTANEPLAPIHNRMPVILSPESYDAWLSEDTKLRDMRNLLSPHPASEMKSHPVCSDVNQPKVDEPHLITLVDETLGRNLSLF
jgi:hypothetical protein